MDVDLGRRLGDIERAILQVGGAVAAVAGVQREHGEQLRELINLLDQEEGEREGPTLEEMIGALITRMDTQSEGVTLILQGVRALSQDLPRTVAGRVVQTLNGELEPQAGSSTPPRSSRS